MRYWEAFQDKYGFDDGANVQSDACELREIYVNVINKLLEKHGSIIRLKAFDRPGMHNPYLIVKTFPGMHNPYLIGDSFLNVPSGKNEGFDESYNKAIDEGYNKAIKEAEKLDLDQLTNVEVTVNKRLYKKILKSIEKE